MCNFASMVLTKEAAYWCSNTDSHEDIIERHGLHADGVRGPNVLRVEITPPEDNPRSELDLWRYRIDQDELPEWIDGNEEHRAREALAARATKERWMVTETVGAGESCICSYAGTATAGEKGIVVVRYWDQQADRYRVAVGYCGDDGIDAGKPYRWDADKGCLVEVIK